MKLDDKDIGTVTINSADKQQDYTINGYQIAVVVKEANGEFAKISGYVSRKMKNRVLLCR